MEQVTAPFNFHVGGLYKCNAGCVLKCVRLDPIDEDPDMKIMSPEREIVRLNGVMVHDPYEYEDGVRTFRYYTGCNISSPFWKIVKEIEP